MVSFEFAYDAATDPRHEPLLRHAPRGLHDHAEDDDFGSSGGNGGKYGFL
jgi:hypothetical protein